MKDVIKRIVTPNESGLVELLLRVYVGATMIYHGSGKLIYFSGTVEFFRAVGIEPAGLMTVMAGLGESLGGIALIVGLFSRLGATVNCLSMFIAIIFVGWPNGFDIRDGGWEYEATLMFVFMFIAIQGAGKYSLDYKLFNKLM